MEYLCQECFVKKYGKKIGEKKICLSKEERVCENCSEKKKIVVGLEPSIIEIMLGAEGFDYF